MTTTRAPRPMGPGLGHGHTHAHNFSPEDYQLAIHLSPGTARDLEDRRGARTTLSHFDDSSGEDNDFDDDGDDDEDDDEDDDDMQTPTSSNHSHIPLHPISSMQEAFAESLEEATKSGLSPKPRLRAQNAKARREKLLDEDKSQGPPNRLWRFRPGQKCHELRKLIAQVSFGVELLIRGMANSNAQVLEILQGHIDEVDEFLETAMEDVQEATTDLKQRLDLLKVPMENMSVFEQMLENRKFRLQIVEGNVKIERILSRTSTAHAQTIRDISEGIWAIKKFSEYLTDNETASWRQDRPDVVDVFDAMKGNTEGWYNAFTALESSSTLLSGLLVQLSSLVVDIDKKAGEVSRRTRFTLEPYSDPDSRSHSRTPESPSQATPPPSPPTTSPQTAPRIKSLYFGDSMAPFLEGPESPGALSPPPRSRHRFTKDSDTLRNTMLETHTFTPPESSKIIPEVVIAQEAHVDDDSESQSVTGSTSDASTASSSDDNSALYVLQPRTYTPIPPAPIPSPRVSAVQQREIVVPRGTPDELSIHIEAEEDMPLSPDLLSQDDLRETILEFPEPNLRRISSLGATPRPLQPVQASQERQSRLSDKEVVFGHRTSLRERVEKLPTAIHVPPMNDYEIRRPRYPTPQGSLRGQDPPGSSHGPHLERPRQPVRHNTTNLDFSPPKFPSLIPSPASERQHFRPVQASPHSPLQQRPHTANPTAGRSQSQLHHHSHSHSRHQAPSQMGMSMLSNVAETTTREDGGDARAGSTRTVKKKRSAFGWLKKAFSLDEEERAAFEARRNAQPMNYYAAYGGHSPRYLDGKRVG